MQDALGLLGHCQTGLIGIDYKFQDFSYILKYIKYVQASNDLSWILKYDQVLK